MLKKLLAFVILVSALAGCSSVAKSSSVSEETVYIPAYKDYVSVQQCGDLLDDNLYKRVKSYYYDESGYLVRYVLSDWYDLGHSPASPKTEKDLQKLAESMRSSGYRRVYAIDNILVREYSDYQIEDHYINRHESKEEVVAGANAECLSEDGCLIEENEEGCTAQVDYNPDDLLKPESEEQ